jgi:hypothetical protein
MLEELRLGYEIDLDDLEHRLHVQGIRYSIILQKYI